MKTDINNCRKNSGADTKFSLDLRSKKLDNATLVSSYLLAFVIDHVECLLELLYLVVVPVVVDHVECLLELLYLVVVPVVVDHVECLLELLYLVLVEHGKDIAGSSLGPLLGGSPTGGCLAGRHC